MNTNLCPLCGYRERSDQSRDIQLCLICDKAMTEDVIDELRKDREELFKRAETAEEACINLYKEIERLEVIIFELKEKNKT